VECYGVSTAGRFLDFDRRTICSLIEAGDLTAVRRRERLYVSGEELFRFVGLLDPASA